MTKEKYEKHKYNIFSLFIIITELEANKIDEVKACKRIEKINFPLDFPSDYLDALIQYAINHEYSQIYLIVLKKKEQLNGFNLIDIKENFEL